MIPQYEVERALERRAAEAGVRFVYETEVTGLRQDTDGVTLDVRHPDGEPGELRGAYVVGTDGMHSAVREAVGLPFPGKSVIRSVVLADVRLAEEPESVLTANAVGDAFAFIAPFGDGYYRVIGWHRGRNVPDSEPLGLDEVRRSPGSPWAATTACTTPAGCPASTVTSARHRRTASAGSSSPVTPRTSTPRPVVRA